MTEPKKPDYILQRVLECKAASLILMGLSAEERTRALTELAKLVKKSESFLLAENQKDLEIAKREQIASVLVGRLKLDSEKLVTIEKGINDLARVQDPLGKVLSRLKLDDELILEQVSCPLGVVAVVFESRPDVIPQILSLCLRSGNGVLLKGGREARNSNLAFMKLIDELNSLCTFLPKGWAQYFETREEFKSLLVHHEHISLVIPRGSNQLVQSVMAATRIPVLGHADGVCHIYVDKTANLNQALNIILDAKTSYPSACNAVETLLIAREVANELLSKLVAVGVAIGLKFKGCDETRKLVGMGSFEVVDDWHVEHGDLTLSVRVVKDVSEAIQHINSFGSHHTDAVLSTDKDVIESFMKGVDSACVFANCSTRFSDGYRFGKGAEVGISTSKLHARGPVGVEGLITYQYRLSGQGQLVSTYSGPTARPFKHEPM